MRTTNFAAAVAVAALAGLAAAPALAASTWTGSADYGVETVGPFNTYDFASAGVLLIDTTAGSNTAQGYYQSYVAQHMLGLGTVANPLLNDDYEITVVANFTSTQTSATTFAISAGSFALYLDTTVNRNFAADTGFADGTKILEGTVLGGAGSLISFSDQMIGGGSLQLKVTGYDTAVYDPDSIAGGDGSFTLQLNNLVNDLFLNGITSVQGYTAGAEDLKFAADGNLILTPVPEPESYAMLLAGLGLLGVVAHRRPGKQH